MNGSNLETVNSRKINTLAGTPGHLAESALFFVSRSEFARQYQKKNLYPVPKGNMRCTSWKRIYQVHAFSLMFCENQSKTPSSFVHGNNILSVKYVDCSSFAFYYDIPALLFRHFTIICRNIYP